MSQRISGALIGIAQDVGWVPPDTPFVRTPEDARDDIEFQDTRARDFWPTLAIALSEDNSSVQTWRVRVDVTTDEGRYTLGQFITTAPALGDPPARIIGHAYCPGARTWHVSFYARSADAQGTAVVALAGSQCCGSTPGVAKVEHPFEDDTPEEIAGLEMWNRTGDLVVLNGTRAIAVGDLAGNGHDLMEPDPAAQPLYIPSDPAFNGHPSVQLSTTTRLSTLGTVPFGPYTMFIVVGPTSGPAGYVWFRGLGAVGDDYVWSAVGPTAFALNRGGAGNSGKDNSDGAGWSAAAGVKSVCVSMDGTSAGHLLFVNGTSKGALFGPALNPGTNVLANRVFLAADGALGNTSTFRWAELIIYNRALTTNERTRVEAYVRRRYAHY